MSGLLEYESYILYDNNVFNEQSQSSSDTTRKEVNDIVEVLDDLSLDIKKKRKTIKDNNSTQGTPNSIESSLTLLTTVKAKKKEREGMENRIAVI